MKSYVLSEKLGGGTDVSSIEIIIPYTDNLPTGNATYTLTRSLADCKVLYFDILQTGSGGVYPRGKVSISKDDFVSQGSVSCWTGSYMVTFTYIDDTHIQTTGGTLGSKLIMGAF